MGIARKRPSSKRQGYQQRQPKGEAKSISEGSLNGEDRFLGEESLKYDKDAKWLLSLKKVMAFILIQLIPEFRNLTIEEAIGSIDGEVEVNKRRVMPEGHVRSKNTENHIKGEGTVLFDVVTTILLPDGSRNKIILNIEAQKDGGTIYDHITRGIFYCARLLSSQLNREFFLHSTDPKKYANIKKVYSIWVVMEPAKYLSEQILSYRIKPELLYQNPEIDRSLDPGQYYDLLEVIMVYLPYESGQEIDLSHKDEAMDILTTFFSKGYKKDKVETLENVFHIHLSDEDLGKVREMSNLGQGMIDYGVRQGMAQGIAQITLLNNYLMEQNRLDDLARTFKDLEYQQQLLLELAPYYKK